MPPLLLAAVLFADWVPARWFSSDPASLELVKGSAVNCLLVERADWSNEFLTAAARQNVRVLAVIRRSEDAGPARALPFDGYVLEGVDLPMGDRPVIRLPLRRAIRFGDSDPILGTSQGVWPGIEVEHGGPKEAGPTGSAWIHTNNGFLRFVRSMAAQPFWIGVTPPDEALTISRYLQAVADAGAAGARWIVAIDGAFRKRLLTREKASMADWQRLLAHVRFYEENRQWRQWEPKSRLALIQDAASGGLVTGNLLDMLSVMNTPVRAARAVTASVLKNTAVTVTLDPRGYTAEQKAMIARFASGGGKVVAGPEGWKMPVPGGDRFQFDRGEYRQLEAIWPELHSAISRKNFGARLFNVSGAVSHLLGEPGGRVVLQLVNYTDYPLEAVTAFVEGRYRKAVLLTPDGAPRALTVFDAPDGTGIEIDRMGVCGAVVLE